MKGWERFLNEQEGEIGTESVHKWLRPLKVSKFDAGNLYLEAKDPFQVLWFEEHMRAKASLFLKGVSNRPVKIHLSTTVPAIPKPSKTKKQAAVETSKYSIALSGLDPACTFDHFYAADGNLLAHKILLEVAGYQPQLNTMPHSESQLAVFNPIYMYGRSGTGKTHLLMATAHALKQRGILAVYAKAETFTENMVAAIRAGEMSTFRHAYRDVDVLLIDDVHVFSRKASTQEEFFHTFNSLHLSGRQIILSASCAPQELQLIEQRLVSRFEWGIVLPLESLRPIEKVDALRMKAAVLKIPLTPQLQEFLCSTFVSSTKALCRALEALVLRDHLHNPLADKEQPIGVGQARELLQDLIQEEERCALRPEQILQKVAENYGIRIDDLTDRGQTRDTVLPRQLAMYICRQNLKMPFVKIGELFGRDHSTVMSSIRQIEKLLNATNGELEAQHHAILKQLQP